MTAAEHYAEALRSIEGGRLAEAVELLQSAIRLDPSFSEARAALNTTMVRLLAGEEGARRRVDWSSPTEAELLAERGQQFMKAGAWAAAADSFRQARALGYESSALLLDLGESLVRSRHLSEAVSAYQAMVAGDVWADKGLRGKAYPRYFLGAALALSGRNEEALQFLREAVRLVPGLVEGHLALGVVLNSLGRLRDSGDAFEAALLLDPRCLERYPVAFEGQFFFDVALVRSIHESVAKGRQWQGPEST